MANCPSCRTEVTPGTRWCKLCHANIVDSAIGKLAPPGRRLAAHLLDWGVPLAILLMTFITSGAGAVAAESESDVGTGVAGFILLALTCGLLAYALWALILFGQGITPGKKFLGLRVVMEDGSSAGFMTMLVREWVGKWISSLVFGLGFIWILIDDDNQGWHDKFMTTYVVQ